MRLTSLKLTGFKSFARTTELRFPPGITAVIGPNGSGKSNVAEAIRWVLGEQSSKNLRSKKNTDVIFAGNRETRAAAHATVSLTFDNESGRLPVDAAEVTITRALTRAGESEYLVNQDPTRLRDVEQILAEAGFGTKSYTVISQGMVDQYLTATPERRRELFDEATGIKPLKLKLQHAQTQLKQADQRTHELATIVQELKPRLTVLTRQVERQQQRHHLEQHLAGQQEHYFRASWHEAAAHLAHARAAHATVTEHARAARHAREAVEQELLSGPAPQATPAAAARQQLLQAEQAYENQLQRFVQQQQEREQLTAGIAKLQGELRTAQRELTRARARATTQDFFSNLKNVLLRCRALLAKLRQQRLPDHVQLDVLDQEVTQALAELTREDTTLTAAQNLLDRVAGPLQATARLEAVLQERTTRLQQMPDPTPPDATEVERLRALEALQTPPARAQLEERLAATRTQELAATREESAAAAAIEQAAADLAELESIIKRDRGASLLESIQQHPPAADATPPTAGDLHQLTRQLAAIGDIDPLAVKEYEEVRERYEHLHLQHQDATAARTNTASLIRSLKADIHQQFQQQFIAIGQRFTHYFEELFGGGHAKLELVTTRPSQSPDTDGNEPPPTPAHLNGVDITAHPPGKKVRHIAQLSGGEKTLTSIALLLAIMNIQQPPFIVLDEVDAALDEANSYRFATILKELGAHAQVIVITHNRETMGVAESLYGITMNADGVSQVYSVKLSEIAETETGEEMNV